MLGRLIVTLPVRGRFGWRVARSITDPDQLGRPINLNRIQIDGRGLEGLLGALPIRSMCLWGLDEATNVTMRDALKHAWQSLLSQVSGLERTTPNLGTRAMQGTRCIGSKQPGRKRGVHSPPWADRPSLMSR